jgi:hypothetical protein
VWRHFFAIHDGMRVSPTDPGGSATHLSFLALGN